MGRGGVPGPSAENKKKISTAIEEKTKVEKQERHGRVGELFLFVLWSSRAQKWRLP